MNKYIQDYVRNYPDQVQEQIDDIMDNFDFDKVAKVMEFLNWGWVKETGGYGTEVPDKYQIRKKARKMLREVTFGLQGKSNTEEYSIDCGGFLVHCYVCDYGEDKPKDWVDDANHQIVIFLKFILEESSTLL